MTPSKHGTTTSIRIEKVIKSQIDQSMVAHTAGGQHKGLVINKQSATGKLTRWCSLKLRTPWLHLKSFRVPTHPEKSWEVLDLFFLKFPGPGKSWKMRLVLESPGN